MLAMHIIPVIAKQPLSRLIFCFEELENNLHPALQKRLFRYIADLAIENESHVFITTHSHIVIDLFSRDHNTQIIHVTHDPENKGQGKVGLVYSRSHHSNIFDDLEVKASDLLQSNCSHMGRGTVGPHVFQQVD